MSSSTFGVIGLLDRDLEEIRAVLASCPAVDRAILFGSRAKGNHRPGSDVDIAICGDSVSFDIVTKIHGMLEDQSKMPYLFDVVDYTHLQQKELKVHIDRVGITIYQRQEHKAMD